MHDHVAMLAHVHKLPATGYKGCHELSDTILFCDVTGRKEFYLGSANKA